MDKKKEKKKKKERRNDRKGEDKRRRKRGRGIREEEIPYRRRRIQVPICLELGNNTTKQNKTKQN